MGGQYEGIRLGTPTEQHPLVPLRYEGRPVLDLVDGDAGCQEGGEGGQHCPVLTCENEEEEEKEM